jgi:hypothetical protein
MQQSAASAFSPAASARRTSLLPGQRGILRNLLVK